MDEAERDEVCRALRGHFLFEGLTVEQIGALAANVWIERIPGRSLIVREGDEADALYLVLVGGVDVTKADGQFLAFLGPGGFFGEMALFMEGARRSANCESTEDTTCVVVRKDILDEFCTGRPDAGLTIMRTIIGTLAERLKSTSADLAFLMGAQVKRQSQVDSIVETTRRRGTDRFGSDGE